MVCQIVGILITDSEGVGLIADRVTGAAGNLREYRRIKYQRGHFTVLGIVKRQAYIPILVF